jgi:hypothetical protein
LIFDLNGPLDHSRAWTMPFHCEKRERNHEFL